MKAVVKGSPTSSALSTFPSRPSKRRRHSGRFSSAYALVCLLTLNGLVTARDGVIIVGTLDD
jgi:hypothetical protein